MTKLENKPLLQLKFPDKKWSLTENLLLEPPILMLCFIDVQVRIETDPADRTQLRMTVASGDPTVTFEYVL